jgi:hypothetical protein
MKSVEHDVKLDVEAFAELFRIIAQANRGELRLPANVARKIRHFCAVALEYAETDPRYDGPERRR